MKSKFENPPPISREQLEEALLSGDAFTAAEALIRMAFWESDCLWAEHKSLSALRDGRK
jgi:hypothetical protein